MNCETSIHSPFEFCAPWRNMPLFDWQVANTKLAHVQPVSPALQALPSLFVQLRPVYVAPQSVLEVTGRTGTVVNTVAVTFWINAWGVPV